MKTVVIGSRGSLLALWQANHIADQIKRHRPGLEVRIDVIKTTGDKLSEAPLARFGTAKGLFVKEIEEALLAGKADLAVHSLKDLPTELPEGLGLAAVPPREDPRDALVSDYPYSSLEELPKGARLGTGSLRRMVPLRFHRPDIVVEELRGNVDTRLRKMREQGLEGLVLAAAGLRRLGRQESIAFPFAPDVMVPAIGQGALAIEARTGDNAVLGIVEPLNDPATLACTGAERKFLRKMGGGCQVPMGAHAWIEEGTAFFIAVVAGASGDSLLTTRLSGPPELLPEMAAQAVKDLLERGARAVLAQAGIEPLS
jgi:hydroxymethylbilane synthase